MPELILKGYIEVPETDLQVVIMELPIHIALTRKENGCLDFQVTQDSENKCRFNVYEKFENKEAFEKHQIRVKLSHWGKITKNVHRNYDIEIG